MKHFHEYKKEYVSDGGKSYLVIQVPIKEQLKYYQIEMLEKNKPERLIPLLVQRVNDDWKFYYDITSRIPLERILERKRIDMNEFEQIINHTAELGCQLRDYLLDISSVVLDKTSIYCDPSGLSLYFLYFPVATKENDPERLKKFLKKLVTDDICLMDDKSGVLLKRVLEFLKKESFHSDELSRCVREAEEQKWNNSGNALIMKGNTPNRTPIGNEKTKHMNIPGEAKERDKPLSMNPIHEKKNVIKHFKIIHNKDSLQYPMSSYWITGLLNAVLIGLLIVLLATGTNSNRGSSILGFLLIMAASNYYAISRLFSKERKIPSMKEKAEIKRDANRVRYVNAAVNGSPDIQPTMKSVTPGKRMDSLYPVAKKLEEIQGFGTKTDDPPKSTFYSGKRTNSDKTMVLGERTRSVPYLQSQTVPYEKISIDKASLFIGRLDGSVDYVIHNNAVGKIHAEIVQKDDQYYIIDLNSVNGTYINGKKIASNTETLIKSGDNITLANASYLFVT